MCLAITTLNCVQHFFLISVRDWLDCIEMPGHSSVSIVMNKKKKKMRDRIRKIDRANVLQYLSPAFFHSVFQRNSRVRSPADRGAVPVAPPEPSESYCRLYSRLYRFPVPVHPFPVPPSSSAVNDTTLIYRRRKKTGRATGPSASPSAALFLHLHYQRRECRR